MDTAHIAQLLTDRAIERMRLLEDLTAQKNRIAELERAMQNQVATMKWLTKWIPDQHDLGYFRLPYGNVTKSEVRAAYKLAKTERDKFVDLVMRYVFRYGQEFTIIPIQITDYCGNMTVASMKEHHSMEYGSFAHCIIGVGYNIKLLPRKARNILVINSLDRIVEQYGTPDGIVYEYQADISAERIIVLLERKTSKFNGNINITIRGTDGSNIVRRVQIIEDDIDFYDVASVRAHIPSEFTALPEFKEACAQFDLMMNCAE